MTTPAANSTTNYYRILPWWQIALLSFAAVTTFHLAYLFPSCAFLMIVFLFCLLQLTNLQRWRPAFYLGLGIGLLLSSQMGSLWDYLWPGSDRSLVYSGILD